MILPQQFINIQGIYRRLLSFVKNHPNTDNFNMSKLLLKNENFIQTKTK